MSILTEHALLDTNVLVYAYAEQSPHRQKAAALLQECLLGRRKRAITLQNIAEFCDVAVRKYGLDITTVKEIVEELMGCGDLIKIHYSETTLQKALDIVRKHKIRFWDALIAATMLEQNMTRMYTEDHDFVKIPGIKAVNPFKK